jgi:thioredoxin 1
MKKLLIVCFTLLSMSTFAQSAAGISFEHSNWDAAIKKAKAENKLIFMDAYTSWCGPCKALQAKVFPDKKLGDFFNANFVNIKIDMEEGEGPKIATIYPVRGYPTLFFIDPTTGKVVNEILGYKDINQLLAFGVQVQEQKAKNVPTVKVKKSRKLSNAAR